jgi:bifunctional DNA-binding transcriptional regulator/antitoxin component of YhaV-PrlF toxin-antitoxin module
MTVFSSLNVESARLARRGKGPAAARLARAAADLESGPEFARLQQMLMELPGQEAERVVEGVLPEHAAAPLTDALRAIALRTEQGRTRDLDLRSSAEIAFAGQVAELHTGYVMLSQAGGPATMVPRWMIDVAHRDQVGALLVLVADKLDDASAVVEAVPGIDIDDVTETRELSPVGRGEVRIPVLIDADHTTGVSFYTMGSMEGTAVKVTRNGQVSVPAAVRHRWGASTMLIVDRGDYAIIRPVPNDPITALRGAYATPGLTAEEARAADRAAEAGTEDRRRGNAG